MTVTREHLDIFGDALDLIRDRRHWTKRLYNAPAVNELNEPIPATTNNERKCFCSAGALHYAYDMSSLSSKPWLDFELRDLLERIALQKGPKRSGLVTYNDSHTHWEVMKLWGEAAEILLFFYEGDINEYLEEGS